MIKLADIEQEYLRSFTLDHSPATLKSVQKPSLEEKIGEGKLSIEHVDLMDERTKTEVAFSKILPHAKQLNKKLSQEKERVIDQYSWQDLNLIAGNMTTPEKSALNYIKKTATTLGSSVMATQIVNPTTKQEEIISKQKVTEELLAKEEVAEAIDKSIKKVEVNEALGFSLWQEDNDLNHKEYKKELNRYYFGRFGLGKKNSSSWLLQAKKLWKDLWLHPILGFSVVVCLIYTLFWGFTNPIIKLAAYMVKGRTSTEQYNFLLSKIRHSIGSHLMFFFMWDMIFPFISLLSRRDMVNGERIWGFQHYYRLLTSTTEVHTKITILAITLGKILLGIYLVYKAYQKYLRNRSILRFLADHLIPVQNLVVEAGKISHIIANNPILEKHYGHHLSATRALLAASQNPADSIALLVAQLQKVNLHNRFYFFNNTGRLLATYELFKKNKEALADLYYEIGLMDAQLSIYKLMKEARESGSENQFVFGKLEKADGDLPSLNMKGMWHFGLAPNKVIHNDVVLNSKEGPRTTIITGPNAGGKSTYILGTCLNVILNQVYGIVAANSAVHAIFYKIITYVNPVQNLAAGLSLAEAGMQVLKQHKVILEKAKKPVLAIIDELLNGTDPKVAAEYSYKILESRNKDYSNCITLLTTHFMELTKLAKKNNLIKNRKVVVNIPGKNGKKFDYTYEIKDGITDQNIVQYMLTEKGIL